MYFAWLIDPMWSAAVAGAHVVEAPVPEPAVPWTPTACDGETDFLVGGNNWADEYLGAVWLVHGPVAGEVDLDGDHLGDVLVGSASGIYPLFTGG